MSRSSQRDDEQLVSPAHRRVARHTGRRAARRNELRPLSFEHGTLRRPQASKSLSEVDRRSGSNKSWDEKSRISQSVANEPAHRTHEAWLIRFPGAGRRAATFTQAALAAVPALSRSQNESPKDKVAAMARAIAQQLANNHKKSASPANDPEKGTSAANSERRGASPSKEALPKRALVSSSTAAAATMTARRARR